MILTYEEISQLNQEMLGRGVPNQKDDFGYNKPDFNAMYMIGMLNTERTLEETVVTLIALKNYTNTQLQGYKDDIEESYQYYNQLFNKKYKDFAKEYEIDDEDYDDIVDHVIEKTKKGNNHDKEDYEPREIKYFGIENGRVKVALGEYVNQLDIQQFKGKWGVTENGEKVAGGFTIPVKSIEPFLEYIKDKGMTGFKAPQKMKEDVDRIKKPTEIGYYGMKNDMAYISFKDNKVNDFHIENYNGKWFKSSKLSFLAMGIPSYNLERFLNDIKQDYNFLPTEKLKEDISKLTEEQLKIPATYYKLSATNEVNKYGFNVFRLNMNTPKLVQELWSLKGTAVRYVQPNRDGTLDLSVTPDLLPALCKYLEPKGIDCYEAKHFREIKNKSGNTLKDVTHSDLPFKPYDFQIEDAKKIIGMKRALIGHDMGCGKTLIATMVGESLKDDKKLVVCPESLRLNWEKEIKQFNKDADVNIIYSNTKTEKVDLNHEWNIMGFATVRKFAPIVINSDINAMFVDEAHNCKSVGNSGKPSSKQAESVLAIADKVDYCYPMTGTPMPTRNKDLFNTFRMLKEYESNKAFFNFGKEFCGAYNNGFGMDYNGSSNEKELHELLNKYMIRRIKKDVLPNLQKQRVFIPLENSLMSKEVKDNEKQLRSPQDDETFMGLAMKGRNLLSQCKIKSAIDLTKSHVDAEESVVVVSEFNETLDRLQEEFGDKACCIRGGMSDISKQQSIDDFQSGKKPICLLNLKAGGVGITLTKAHTMVMCDYDWTPANMTQVEDRICRTGQEHLCNIEYLYFPKSTLDNVFINMITNKSETIDKIVDNTENTVNLKNERKNNATFLDNLKKKIELEKKITRKKKTEKTHEEETTDSIDIDEPIKQQESAVSLPTITNDESNKDDSMSLDDTENSEEYTFGEQLSLTDNDDFLIG